MPSYRDEYRRPGRIPDKSMLFLGADPAWTPEKESPPPTACRACGGVEYVDGHGAVPVAVLDGEADPLPVAETTVFVCKCGRAHYRHLRGGEFPPNEDVLREYADVQEHRTTPEELAATSAAVLGPAKAEAVSPRAAALAERRKWDAALRRPEGPGRSAPEKSRRG